MSDCRFGVSPVNYPDPDSTMGYGQGKLAHFRRVKLAHLFSKKKKISEIKSVFYSIFGQ